MEPIIATNGRATKQNGGRNGRTVTLRSPEMREIAHNLATLGVRRVGKADALNVRRREAVRRALIEAGEELGWAQVAALRDDPVEVAARDVKKILRSGVRSLKRAVSGEMAEKEAEGERLEEVVETIRSLAADPDLEYPTEITYTRTAKNAVDGFVTKTETIEVSDPEEAMKAAKKIEESLPRWAKQREEMLEDLRRRQQRLEEANDHLAEVVDSWRGLFGEVLVLMR
jgi:predicted transcriptional regulator